MNITQYQPEQRVVVVASASAAAGAGAADARRFPLGFCEFYPVAHRFYSSLLVSRSFEPATIVTSYSMFVRSVIFCF